MSGFSEDFSTLDGKKRSDIEEKAARFFEEYTTINITLRDVKTSVDTGGETATAEVGYTLECVAMADGNVHRRSDTLIFNFRKEEPGWKITSAE